MLDRSPEILRIIERLLDETPGDTRVDAAPEVSADAMRSVPAHLAAEVEQPANDGFGPVIDRYTRADQLSDGSLVAAPADLQRDLALFPVALTRAAFLDCVSWTPADEQRSRTAGQSETGRWWDVLNAIKWRLPPRARLDADFEVQLLRRPRPGTGRVRRVVLLASITLDDSAKPVITVRMPDETTD